MRPIHLCAIALLFPAACKPPEAHSITLKDAPPPELPEGWQTVAIEGAGFTFAVPSDWRYNKLERAQLEEQVKLMNEVAWESMGQRKADVDFETAQAVIAGFESSAEDMLFNNKMVSQTLIAIREDTGRKLSLQDASDRWKDVIRLEGDKDEPKVGVTELPVGAASTITASNVVIGIIEKITVYCIVDGSLQYTFIFFEEAQGNVQPIPVQAIMSTFRPQR